MRIIGGELRGRRFNPPANLKARPTTDMAKESLFDILNNRLDYEDMTVLDMFGGTGSISYEFASRCCKNVVTIEMNYTNYAFIQKTVRDLKIENMNVIKGDTFKFVESTGMKFDLIFADPPYDNPKLPEIPSIVFERGLLAPGGILILEHPKTFSFDNDPHFFEHRRYGHVNFSFFKAEKEE